jgi:hypothetical protein
MTNVPQYIWNELAKAVTLRTAWAKRMFALNQDQVVDELNKQAKQMEQQGTPDAVISAYQDVLPLWIERQAISEYVEKANDPHLRTMLPELTEPSEAVNLMTQEHHLNGKEAATLYELLTKQTPN